MSKAFISKAIRRRLMERDRRRCVYCLSQERITGQPMDIDHIIPEARGGPTSVGNLCLACGKCNQYKGEEVTAPDPLTEISVPLFHPLEQSWSDHFSWSPEGDRVIGLTPTGRATVEALKLNRIELVNARREWVKVGWHPPKDNR